MRRRDKCRICGDYTGNEQLCPMCSRKFGCVVTIVFFTLMLVSILATFYGAL